MIEIPEDKSFLWDGDESSFQSLFIDYYPLLVSFGMKYIEGREVVEDVVQDVFVRLWEGRGMQKISNLSAYLYQAVRLRCLNIIRDEKNKSRIQYTISQEQESSYTHHYIEEETYRLMMQALEQLPLGSRRVFATALEGYSSKEISEKLGIAVETVKKQKQIARRILREKLGKLLIWVVAITS